MSDPIRTKSTDAARSQRDKEIEALKARSPFEQDRKQLDLVGFSETCSTRVVEGPSGTILVEQNGFFAVSNIAKVRASRYVLIKKSAIPDLIKDLRALSR